MPSRSSPPRNGSPVSREHATALLEDGVRVEAPPDDLLAAAEHLRGCGLISFGVREFVQCVEPRDADFPPRNRTCQGRIFLEDGQDEDADEIRCPKCDRPVRPYSLNKRRQRVLQPSVSQAGVVAWIRERLAEVSTSVADVGDHAFRADGFAALGVVVCVADADGPADSRFNSAAFAATNPVCYVTINPAAPEGRFLRDEWVSRVALADLVSGAADLRKVLTDLASARPASTMSRVDVPVYAKGHVPIQPELKPQPRRVFVVELGRDVVRVNGEVVINPQAGPRLALFRILWDQYVADVAGRKAVDEFAALTIKKLMAAMKTAGHVYGDETSLRKLVNNLQSDIETAIKRKVGTPIGREDIVQTCRMSSQSDASGGYRLNPLSVTIRPFQTP
ncbi:MAG: hypothetical protein KF768_05445 [Phycisphaeraceae bacterium]|nr:hypothetical protein [Phycisphaeraceae bacterium]